MKIKKTKTITRKKAVRPNKMKKITPNKSKGRKSPNPEVHGLKIIPGKPVIQAGDLPKFADNR